MTQEPKIYILFRDGKEIMSGNEFEVLKYIHRNHSYSFDHAIKYEGYSMKEKVNTSSR